MSMVKEPDDLNLIPRTYGRKIKNQPSKFFSDPHTYTIAHKNIACMCVHTHAHTPPPHINIHTSSK